MTPPTIVRLGGRGWDCNQFLVKDPTTNHYDMVDAGHGMDFNQVLQQVRQLIEPTRLRTVVVTHEHLDHVNGLPKWRQLGGRLAASRQAALKLHDGRDPTSEKFGSHIPALDVDDVLSDGDHVRLGDRDFTVLETPGHSPGSACYWDEQSGTLFSGDTLFDGGGIGRFDFPDSNLQQIYESILRLGKLPVKVLHCGHGPSTEGEAAKRSVAASVRHVSICHAESGAGTHS
jgi:hydroxyacylglutathione hydrolase